MESEITQSASDRGAAFKRFDQTIQQFTVNVYVATQKRLRMESGLPSFPSIAGDEETIALADVGPSLYLLAAKLNSDMAAREIIYLLKNNPLYKTVVTLYPYYLHSNKNSDMGTELFTSLSGLFILPYWSGKEWKWWEPATSLDREVSLLYLDIINEFLNDSYTKVITPQGENTIPKYNEQYSTIAKKIIEEAPSATSLGEQYRLAKIALYLRMYPDLVDLVVSQIPLNLDLKIAVMQALLAPSPSEKVAVIKDYLRRHNLPLTGWMDVIADYSKIDKQPNAIIEALYSVVERQIQPGGSAAKDVADEFDRQRGALSKECDGKQYPELEDAAVILVNEASLANLCQAVVMFQDRLDLTGSCSDAEITDIVDVMMQLIPTLSKRELCALIGVLGGHI